MPAFAVARTPRGSSIERLRPGRYRVCDTDHHCREVEDVWTAFELVRELELEGAPVSDTSLADPS
jgi:hypothetical protein